MQKNFEYVGEVIDVGINGEGIIKQDGLVVFVPFSYLGEKVKFLVLKIDKNVAYGKLKEVICPSKFRVEPRCEVFGKCGGCTLQHIKYEEQLNLKKALIKNTFKKIANLDIEVENVFPSDNEYRYRNKLQLPVVYANGENLIGFYANNSHRVVPINDCPINPKWTKELISGTYEYLKNNNLKGYREGGNFDLREVTAREIDGKLIVVFIFKDKKDRNTKSLIKILDKKFGENYSLFYNYNDGISNVIYGKDFELVKGEPFYYSEIFGIKFKMGVQSFMQVNFDVCKKLYKFVVDKVGDDSDTVIDAYSGAGLMTAMLSKKAKRTFGIEIIPEAVANANELFALNNLGNKASNYLGKCEEILPDIIDKVSKKGNVSVVMDPPRKGCDKKVIEAIIKSKPKKIVYVSCMPSTLARDAGIFTGSLKYEDGKIIKGNGDGKYFIESITAFDMFPQSKHVETVCHLIRK